MNSEQIILREWILPHNSIPKRLNQKGTALVSFPQTSLNLIGCEFIGNETD